MAPVSPRKTIEHFSHPEHRLVELLADTEYLCDGCKTPGQGTRYRCHPCDFDLHEYCGTCPRTLKSFMHPHSLSLVQRTSQSTRQNERTCNVCSDPVNGLFYRCRECDFDLHPLCTQLPEKLNHVLHQVHPLRLESTIPGSCRVCGLGCTSWRYRCGGCCVDIHLECVLIPSAPPTKERGGPTTERGIPPPTSPTHPMHTPFANHGYGVPGHLHPLNPWLYATYANGYGMHGHQQHYQFQPPPPWMYGAHGYGYPYSPAAPLNNNANQPNNGNQQNNTNQQGQEGGSSNGKMGKKMFAIVGRLTMGVVSSVVFGAPIFG